MLGAPAGNRGSPSRFDTAHRASFPIRDDEPKAGRIDLPVIPDWIDES